MNFFNDDNLRAISSCFRFYSTLAEKRTQWNLHGSHIEIICDLRAFINNLNFINKMYKKVYIRIHTSHHQMLLAAEDSILICVKTAVKLNYKKQKKRFHDHVYYLSKKTNV
jgi:hypothetical protein